MPAGQGRARSHQVLQRDGIALAPGVFQGSFGSHRTCGRGLRHRLARVATEGHAQAHAHHLFNAVAGAADAQGHGGVGPALGFVDTALRLGHRHLATRYGHFDAGGGQALQP